MSRCPWLPQLDPFVHAQRTCRLLALLFLFVAGATGQTGPDPHGPWNRTQRLGLALRRAECRARILYVTAHPDDEDNAVLAWAALGRGAQVTLLTLTRGQGGQNLVGEESYAALALLRVGELEAARRVDGAEQLLGPFVDFGYSFSDEETFAKWGQEVALDHLIRVVRALRPDIVITMPSDHLGGGRHHQSSARLTANAIDLAAQTALPELGTPHAVTAIWEQSWVVPLGGAERLVPIPVNDFDALLGSTYAEIGARARACHKSQTQPQVWPGVGARARSVFRARPGPGGSAAAVLDPLAVLTSTRPSVAVDVLRPDRAETALEAALLEVTDEAHRSALERARLEACGVVAYALGARETVSGGETLAVRVLVENQGARSRRITARFRGPIVGGDGAIALEGSIAPGRRLATTAEIVVPFDTTFDGVSLPRADGERYDLGVERIPSSTAGQLCVEIEGLRECLIVPLECRTETTGYPAMRTAGVARVPTLVANPSTDTLVLRWRAKDPPTEIPESSASRSPEDAASFLVESRHDGVRRIVPVLAAPDGARVELPDILIPGPGRHDVRIAIPPGPAGSWRLRLQFEGGRDGTAVSSSIPIDHPHVSRRFLRSDAELRIERVTFRCASARVVYVSGVGDRMPGTLPSVLPHVEVRSTVPSDLSKADVVVLGPRALERAEISSASERLEHFVREGGRLVVQYQRQPNAAASILFAGARFSERRVTDESSPVEISHPEHLLLTDPNAISPEDFDGWVQERATYLLDSQDVRWMSLLRLRDPWQENPGEQEGALVEGRLGEGRVIYVGLALFRQLPHGVPGAWRLFANLISPEARR